MTRSPNFHPAICWIYAGGRLLHFPQVRRCRARYEKFEEREMTIEEAIHLLDTLVDDSDPDTDVPNSLHDFQTAERIRQCWPGEEYVGAHPTVLAGRRHNRVHLSHP